MKNSLYISAMLIILIVSPFTLGIYLIVRDNNTDCLLPIIVSFIIGLLYIYMLYNISKYKNNLCYIDKIKSSFSKPFNFILQLLLFISVLFFTINKIHGLSDYITSQFLTKTPSLVIGIVFTLLIIYANLKDINVLKKLSLTVLIINTISIILILLGIIPDIQLNNLKPMFITNPKIIFNDALYLFFINTIPSFLILEFDKNISKKTFFLSYIYAYFIMFIIMFGILSILGVYLIDYYQYPAYVALQYVNVFNFINRVENILNIQWILGLFISALIGCYYLSNYFNKKIFRIIIPCIVLILSIILFKNNLTFYDYAAKLYPIVGSIIFICNFILFLKLKIDH